MKSDILFLLSREKEILVPAQTNLKVIKNDLKMEPNPLRSFFEKKLNNHQKKFPFLSYYFRLKNDFE
jgi:hypothetical protein